MKDIVLVGGGGHCKAVIDVLEATAAWRIAGIVERHDSEISEVMGYEVIGFDEDLAALHKRYKFAFVTCGQIKTPEPRIRIFRALKASGFVLPTLVSPRAHVARSVVLGEGTIIMHGAHIGPDVRIGTNTIVNSGALVEHDASIGSHCHIATSACINGGVSVGDRSLIGSGVVCREGTSIGADCIVGMGTRVLKPLPNGTLFIGEHVE